MNSNTMDVNKDLLEKYYRGYCTDMEKQLVEKWLLSEDAFTGVTCEDNSEAKERMWHIVSSNTVNRKWYIQHITAIAASLLVLLATGLAAWLKIDTLPAESVCVIIDNTRGHLQAPKQLGSLILSESANGPINSVTIADRKDRLVYASSLIINNQRGEDTWVYLKINNEKGSEMKKFLCRKKTTYVASYITEYGSDGSRKYLYSKALESVIPREFASSINSQLNAAKINGKQRGHTTIII